MHRKILTPKHKILQLVISNHRLLEESLALRLVKKIGPKQLKISPALLESRQPLRVLKYPKQLKVSPALLESRQPLRVLKYPKQLKVSPALLESRQPLRVLTYPKQLKVSPALLDCPQLPQINLLQTK
jgi:hypothetical protein